MGLQICPRVFSSKIKAFDKTFAFFINGVFLIFYISKLGKVIFLGRIWKSKLLLLLLFIDVDVAVTVVAIVIVVNIDGGCASACSCGCCVGGSDWGWAAAGSCIDCSGSWCCSCCVGCDSGGKGDQASVCWVMIYFGFFTTCMAIVLSIVSQRHHHQEKVKLISNFKECRQYVLYSLLDLSHFFWQAHLLTKNVTP